MFREEVDIRLVNLPQVDGGSQRERCRLTRVRVETRPDHHSRGDGGQYDQGTRDDRGSRSAAFRISVEHGSRNQLIREPFMYCCLVDTNATFRVA